MIARNGVYGSNTATMTAIAEVPTDLATLGDHAAEFPGLGLRLLRRWAYEGRLPVYRLGGKVLVSRADLAEFIRAGRVEPTAS